MVEQIMLVGQDERQLGALIVPNIEELKTWEEEKSLNLSEDFLSKSSQKTLRKELQGHLNVLLAKRVGSRNDERISGLAFVEPFTIQNGLLTQTLKQRREKIAQRDQLEIDEIYGR